MAELLVLLLATAAFVWFLSGRPDRPTPTDLDRDDERQLAELRALPGSPADIHLPAHSA